MLTDKKKYNQEYYKKNRTRLLIDWKKEHNLTMDKSE